MRLWSVAHAAKFLKRDVLGRGKEVGNIGIPGVGRLKESGEREGGVVTRNCFWRGWEGEI